MDTLGVQGQHISRQRLERRAMLLAIKVHAALVLAATALQVHTHSVLNSVSEW